jgi:chemotaxis protein methyltransferase CheR
MSNAIASRPDLPGAWEAPALLTPELFERLRDALSAYSGISLDATQRRALEAALVSRLASTGLTLPAYEQQLLAPLGRTELRRLAELLVNHETFFFRNPAQIHALRTVLLPEIHRRKPAAEPIRIWSAGCASGEESYSLAIAALEALGHTARPIEVVGSDLSELALARARTGFYRGRALQNVSPAQRARFFRPQDDGFVVNETVRGAVQFVQHNLLEPFPPFVQGCDVIVCQNVTIYFQPEARHQLIARFFASLPAGGLLCLGFSETLWNVFDSFRTREVAGTYVYYKESHIHLRCRRPANDRPPIPHKPSRAPQPSERRSSAQQPVAKSFEARGAANATLAVARDNADRGEMAAAEAALLALIDQDSLHEEAYVLLGQIYARQGAWPAAVSVLERARYLRPNDPVVSFHLAGAYQASERAELAAREYRAVLRKLEPHPPDAIIEGAAVRWLRETCERQLDQLLGVRPQR